MKRKRNRKEEKTRQDKKRKEKKRKEKKRKEKKRKDKKRQEKTTLAFSLHSHQWSSLGPPFSPLLLPIFLFLLELLAFFLVIPVQRERGRERGSEI